MSSAFGEPPDSGKKRPAEATGALSSEPATPATAAQATARRTRRLSLRRPTGAAVYRWAGRERAVAGPLPESVSGEARGPAIQERLHALGEVPGGRGLLLDRGLELQLLLHAFVQPRVELDLRAGVGGRRPG